MALCRGAPLACLIKDPPIAARFSGGRKVGGRTLFSASSLLPTLAAGEVFTLLDLDESGVVRGSQGVMFEAR